MRSISWVMMRRSPSFRSCVDHGCRDSRKACNKARQIKGSLSHRKSGERGCAALVRLPVFFASRCRGRIPRRALIDPGAQSFELLPGKSGILVAAIERRHFQVLDLVGSVQDHGTFVAVTWHKGRLMALAALQE